MNNEHCGRFLRKSDEYARVIDVVASGYVGPPLAEAYTKVGVRVIGYDISEDRAAQLNAGQSGMKHIEDAHVQEMLDKNLFHATANAVDLQEADAIIIAVPTPLDVHHQPDLAFPHKTVPF